jgi:hypothetical protein
MAERNPRLLLAFVALNSPRVPVQDQVIALMRDKYTTDPPPTQGAVNDSTTLFALPDATLVFGMMPFPIPWGDLEWPCQTAFWWPQAEEILKKHTHHLIVTLNTDTGTPLERHVLLTKFIAALLESSDAAGVYCGSGRVVHPPEMYCRSAAALTAGTVIPHLWIDLRCWPEEGQGFRFATTGLHAFGILEVEVDRSSWKPNELYDFCTNFVIHLLRRGSTIPDGDTIGRSATEKVKIRHAESLWEREGPVMKIELP